MYTQTMDDANQYVEDHPAAGGDSGENDQVGYEPMDDGGVVGIDSVNIVHSDYADGGSDVGMQSNDCSSQLTLSFRGQVFVFDDVTTEKVQSVLLLLGPNELSPPMHGAESTYQNQREVMDYPKSSHPQRVASLMRFRQKKQKRCYDKKIRYGVRQEVALRMHRKKGQFTSARGSEESVSGNTGEDSGRDDSHPEIFCAHCGKSSKSTPMMRRGPGGPRTLCNACGLFWANKRSMRDLSKRLQDTPSTSTEQLEQQGDVVPYNSDFSH